MKDKEELDSYREKQVKALEKEMAEQTSSKKVGNAALDCYNKMLYLS